MEILYTSELSPFGNRLRIVGALTKRDLSGITAPPGGSGSTAMAEINPFAQVPALVVDGAVLIESLALMEYFVETAEPCGLLPSSPLLRARIRGICRAHDNQAVTAMGPIFAQLRTTAPTIAAAQEGFAKLHEKLGLLSQFFDPAGYAVGQELSLADIAIVPFAVLTNILASRFAVASPYASIPRLANWWDTVRGIPAITAELARHQAAITKAFAPAAKA
jgi:glutathione S-transferase